MERWTYAICLRCRDRPRVVREDARALRLLGIADRERAATLGHAHAGPEHERNEAMATVTVSNEIAAPLDRVFQTFTDIEHGPTRVSGSRSSR